MQVRLGLFDNDGDVKSVLGEERVFFNLSRLASKFDDLIFLKVINLLYRKCSFGVRLDLGVDVGWWAYLARDRVEFAGNRGQRHREVKKIHVPQAGHLQSPCRLTVINDR